MYHLMFDIAGTLVESYDFDTECFSEAVKKLLVSILIPTGHDIRM